MQVVVVKDEQVRQIELVVHAELQIHLALVLDAVLLERAIVVQDHIVIPSEGLPGVGDGVEVVFEVSVLDVVQGFLLAHFQHVVRACQHVRHSDFQRSLGHLG